MSRSKASKNNEMRRRMKNNRHTTREQLLPGKVAKEQMKFDLQYYIMKTQIEKNFPDPTDRLRYINSLMTALGEPDTEIKAIGTGLTTISPKSQDQVAN